MTTSTTITSPSTTVQSSAPRAEPRTLTTDEIREGLTGAMSSAGTVTFFLIVNGSTQIGSTVAELDGKGGESAVHWWGNDSDTPPDVFPVFAWTLMDGTCHAMGARLLNPLGFEIPLPETGLDQQWEVVDVSDPRLDPRACRVDPTRSLPSSLSQLADSVSDPQPEYNNMFRMTVDSAPLVTAAGLPKSTAELLGDRLEIDVTFDPNDGFRFDGRVDRDDSTITFEGHLTVESESFLDLIS